MNSLHNNKKSIHEFLRIYSVFFSTVIMILIAVIITKGKYLSGNNMLNVGERAAAIGIVALGQMLVILTGGLDLSVSGIIAVGYSLTALLLNHTIIPVPMVMLLMLLGTTLAGAANGLIVSKTTVSPFMVTLGTFMIFQSLALVLSKAANLSFVRQVEWLEDSCGLIGVAARFFPSVIWIVISAAVIIMLAYTRLGKNIYLTGGKEFAAKMSGIRTGNIKFFVYTASGFLCGLAALTLEFRLKSGNPSSTGSYQIASIAAVIIGGASLKGGEGNVYGTFIGAFIMASLDNIMNLIGLDVYSQGIVKGAVLLSFVILSVVLSDKGFYIKKVKTGITASVSAKT